MSHNTRRCIDAWDVTPPNIISPSRSYSLSFDGLDIGFPFRFASLYHLLEIGKFALDGLDRAVLRDVRR